MQEMRDGTHKLNVMLWLRIAVNIAVRLRYHNSSRIELKLTSQPVGMTAPYARDSVPTKTHTLLFNTHAVGRMRLALVPTSI